MLESTRTPEWHARRGWLATLLPPVLMAASVIAPILLRPTSSDLSVLFLSVIFLGLPGLIMELHVRKQLSLARTGRQTQGIIDEVLGKNVVNDVAIVKYHFTTDAGELIDCSDPIGSIDELVMHRGGNIAVVFDPQNPKRHMLPEQFWAIRWDRAR